HRVPAPGGTDGHRRADPHRADPGTPGHGRVMTRHSEPHGDRRILASAVQAARGGDQRDLAPGEGRIPPTAPSPLSGLDLMGDREGQPRCDVGAALAAAARVYTGAPQAAHRLDALSGYQPHVVDPAVLVLADLMLRWIEAQA